MSALASAQAAFWAAAYGPEPAAGEAAAAVLWSRPRLSAAAAARIYRESGRARDLEDLTAAYPLLRAGLGEAAFVELCRAYLAATAQRRAPMTRLGAELPAFLERGGWPRPHVDVAALEDMRAAVFSAAGQTPVGPEALAAAAPASARLHFIAALRRRPCVSDMARLAREPAALARPDDVTAPAAELVVWRDHLDIKHTRLAGEAGEALCLAMAGATLEVVCGAFAGRPEPVSAALAALGAWFADGWVARVA